MSAICRLRKGVAMTTESVLPFIYESHTPRVVFGAGSFQKAPEEIERLGAKRVFLMATPGRKKLAEELAARLGDKVAAITGGAAMHAPIESVAPARAEAERVDADCYVAIGGGSAIGLAKAVAMLAPRPILCIPTTYSGSEMTATWGLTEAGNKKTGIDPGVLAKTVIYDPELTLSMPAVLSATSGMNAMAHCVEALYAKNPNPILSLIAEEGIRALGKGLPAVVKDPLNLGARSFALYGAWLAGVALGAAGTALHHKLCHVLGGAFNLPHAETHTVLLPHATAYNAPAAPEAMQRIARALDGSAENGGGKRAAQGIYDLEAGMGAPQSLKRLGMKHDDIAAAAELAVKNPYYNPRAITQEGIRALLEDAYEGGPPRVWSA
jgi:maleylacetate reductase